MSVVFTEQTAITLLIIEARCLAASKLTHPVPDTVDVSSALRGLLTLPAIDITLLVTWASTRLAYISTLTPITDTTLVAVLWEGTGISFWTATIDTDPNPSAVSVVHTGISTAAFFADSIT